MNSRVDVYIRKANQWKPEFAALRKIALESGLTEDLKWGHPCYTLNNGNVILIHGFKNYCAYAFFKGALMKDPKKILIQQTENVQSGRQIRFTSEAEILKMRKTLKAYIAEAIAIEEEVSRNLLNRYCIEKIDPRQSLLRRTLSRWKQFAH